MSNEGLDIPVSIPGAPESMVLLRRIAEALDRTGDAASEASEKIERTKGAWDTAKDAATSAANTYNEVSEALGRVTGTIGAVVTRITELATEQGRLDEMSQRLGLDFDQAAASAGRFADETEAMGVAGRFAAADIRLTQQELDAVMRVAGAASATLGTDTAGAVQQLQEALIRGREGGLQRFGEGLASVAGESHTMQERLQALVAQAGHTAAATDTATDRMNRFKDSLEDAQRVAASAFVNETIRIQAFGTAANDAGGSVEDLNGRMRALGETGAYVLNQVANLAGVVVGSVAVVIASITTPLRQIAAVAANPTNASAAMRGVQESNNEINGFVADRIRGLMSGGQALDERTTADPGASPATTAAQRAANARGRGGTTPEASGWGGSAGLAAAPAAATAAGPGAARASVFATREQLAAAARASDAEALAQQGHEKAVVSAELQRRLSAGNTVAHARAMAEMADQIREKQRLNAELQRELALSAQLAANDQGKGAEQSRLNRQEADRLRADAAREASNLAGKGAEQSRLNRLAEERSNSSRIRSFFAEQANAAVDLRKTVEDAYGAMTGAAGAHFEALVTGQETAGAALQGFVHDTLAAWAKIAAQQAIFELGKGFAALFLNPAEAAAHFGAAALYGVAAAATGGLAAATAPAAASGSARASSGGESQRAASVSPQRRDGGESGGSVTIVNYYAPTFGGREGTEAEIGVRLDRFDDAARARLQRRAA